MHHISIKIVSKLQRRVFVRVSKMYLVVILFGMIPLAYSQKRALDFPQSYIKTTQFECNFNPEWVVNVSCKLKPVSWEKTLANITFDIVKPLTNISANVEIFRRETRLIPFLINITRNVCDILARKGLDFYARLGLELGKKFVPTKLPTCPVTGHIEAINGFLDAGYFNLRLVTGAYLVVVKAFEGYPPKSLGNFKVTCVIAERTQKSIQHQRRDIY